MIIAEGKMKMKYVVCVAIATLLTGCMLVRRAHTGHLIVSLADVETGGPITNAVVTVRCQTKFSLAHTLDSFFTETKAKPDSNGLAHVEFTFYDPDFSWWVDAPKYYTGWFGFGCGDEYFGRGDFNIDTNTVQGLAMYNELVDLHNTRKFLGVAVKFKANSTTYTNNVICRSVCLTPTHNPQPMYGYGEESKVYLPIKNPTAILTNGVEVLRYKPVDFDLKECDIVSDVPNRYRSRGEGIGRTGDFHLERYCIVTNGVKTFYGWMSLAPGCGAYITKKPQGAHFPVVYEANTNAEFLSCIPFEYSSVSGRLVRVDRLLEGDECMILRTRVATNELGEVSSCHYSKILGPVRMSGVMEFQSAIFNPRPNDPNLEFDVDNNLSDYSDGGCYP